MSAVPPAEVVRRLFEAFGRRDVTAILDAVDPRVEFHPITAMVVADGRPYLGHEGMVAYLADVERAWDELDLAIDEVREIGDQVVALGRVHAHGGGRVIDSPAGWLFRLRDGRITWGRVFETRAAAVAAAGVER